MSSSKDDKSETASEIIKKWFFNSPSHGIRRIGRAKTLLGRLFWSYIFWVFTVLMGVFIYIVVIKHITNPTKIRLDVRQDRDRTHFPAVTFCNINPLRDDRFLYDKRKFQSSYEGSTSPLNESEYRKAAVAYIDRILAQQVNSQSHPFVEFGYQLNDILIRCVFNKRLCFQNLTQVFHPTYGNCYTFDNEHHVRAKEAKEISYDWSSVDDNGDDNYKLVLELFLHQNEYNAFLDSRAGFRIFIHRKHEVPMLPQSSLFLGPNKYTKLSFSQRVMSFSRQCRNELTDQMKQIFKNQVRYTQALCDKLCEQRYIEKDCQCISPTLAIFYQFLSNNYESNQAKKNISLCSIDNECLTSRDYFNSSELCRECLPECDIIQYSVQSSYAKYPNIRAAEKVLKRVQDHFPSDQNGKSSSNIELSDNIVAVEITASPFATEILTESLMYTWGDVISSIGGLAGLWIGISLISFVEIIELFYLLINHFCSYFFCK